MAHGAGGRQTSELIDEVFKAHFANPDLTADDAAVLVPPAGKMADPQTILCLKFTISIEIIRMWFCVFCYHIPLQALARMIYNL